MPSAFAAPVTAVRQHHNPARVAAQESPRLSCSIISSKDAYEFDERIANHRLVIVPGSCHFYRAPQYMQRLRDESVSFMYMSEEDYNARAKLLDDIAALQARAGDRGGRSGGFAATLASVTIACHSFYARRLHYRSSASRGVARTRAPVPQFSCQPSTADTLAAWGSFLQVH